MKPNIAIAELVCGVRYISMERSGWPRWSCSGKGETRRNASAESSASRYVGLTAATLKTRSSDARMKAPATRPVVNGYRTMRMLHWSSTSLGYMYPWMAWRMPSSISLPHGPVEGVVEDLRARGHLGLEDMHLVRSEELVDRIPRVLEIDELTRARRAALAARRREALRDPVIAEVALVDRVRTRVDEPAPVWAGLHAVSAAEAIRLVDEDGAVGALECGAHGAHLCARGVRALIAELRNEEALGAVAGLVLLGKTIVAAVGRVDVGMLPGAFDVVALHPCAEEVRLEGHVVLHLAGPHAIAAPDALLDVDDHSPVVIEGLVGGLFRLTGLHGLEVGGRRRGQHEELSGREHEVAAVGIHFFGSLSGACWS